MATIVELSRASALKRPARSKKADHGARAVVVLFPGVRYERAGEATGHVARGSRKRDRLDLED